MALILQVSVSVRANAYTLGANCQITIDRVVLPKRVRTALASTCEQVAGEQAPMASTAL